MEMGRNSNTNVKPLIYQRTRPQIQHSNDKLSTKLIKLGLFIYHFFEGCFQKCGLCKDEEDDEAVMFCFVLFVLFLLLFLLFVVYRFGV